MTVSPRGELEIVDIINHYLEKDEESKISEKLLNKLKNQKNFWSEVKSWTTDAPYRETKSSINAMKMKHVACVEMEASALYAFAKAKNKEVICFAHLTNTMAQEQGDFEKGEKFGSLETLKLIEEVLNILKK